MQLVKRIYRRHSVITYFCGIKIARKKLPRFVINPKEKKSNTPKEILIVNTDFIGDYILMRNFWQEIKNSEKYRNAKITLILNERLPGLPEYLEAGIVDKILYAPNVKGWRAIFFYENVIKGLFEQGLKSEYDTILFPSYNCFFRRYLYYLIISQVKANEIIGTVGDCPPDDSAVFLSFTDVIPVKKRDFEFAMNRDFFETWLGCKIDLFRPQIIIPKYEGLKKYVVISIGASNSFRKWHLLNYARVIEYLQKEYDVECYLIGAESERSEVERLNALTNNQSKLFVGHPLREVIDLVNSAMLYIGNDSGFFHVAAACNTKAICISSGGSYPRFMKYPKAESYHILINDTFLQEAIKRYETMQKDSEYAEINSIRFSDVVTAVNDLLKNTKEVRG